MKYQNSKQSLENILLSGLEYFSSKNIINKIDLSSWELQRFKNIYLVGFGKGSSAIAKELEIKLPMIKNGLVVDTKNFGLKKIKVVIGSHPLPDKINVVATKKIVKICQNAKKNDLIIAIICGGGSSLLTDPVNSLAKTIELNRKLILSGASISEINIARSHLDYVKGGGLAKISFPTNIISLIVSDVPNNNISAIASGPTALDISKINDTKVILEKYCIDYQGIKFVESSKDKRIFSKVKNLIIADNKTALNILADYAKKIGFNTFIDKTNHNDNSATTIKTLFSKNKSNLLLSGGEVKIKVAKIHGKGGRNTHLAALALKYLTPGMAFASIASDGHDNTDAAGAIVDYETIKKCKKLGLNIDKYIANFDSYNLFKKTGNLINTGLLPINVSDIYLLFNSGSPESFSQ